MHGFTNALCMHYALCRESPMHRLTTAQIHQCTDSPLHRFTNARIHQCTDSPMHCALCTMQGFTNAQIHQCTDSPMHRFTNARIHQCTDLSMHGFTNARIHQCTDSPMHYALCTMQGFTNAQCTDSPRTNQITLAVDFSPLENRIKQRRTLHFPPTHFK